MRSTLSHSWLLALPLVCLSGGCNSATESTASAENTTTTASTETSAPVRVAAADKPAEGAPADDPHAGHDHAKGAHGEGKAGQTGQAGADPAYVVSDPYAKYGITKDDLKNAAPDEKALFAAMDHVKVPPPAKNTKVPDKARVVFETAKGKITVELNGKEAPLHTKSFLHLTKLGFYDGTVFHRFADLEGGGKGRIVQGGDPFTKVPTTRKFAGQGGPGYEVPRERNALKHTALVLAAARSQNPNSAGSQFYFTLDPVSFLDEGDGYTVFGKVVDGKDVVMKLQQGDALKKVTVAK
ncbi:MAG TPA: peptidylprolyl isomerase [Abditibacteriaceae bacterium]